VLTFHEYWQDKRIRRKRPVISGTTFLRYGDNIYHRNCAGIYLQENSFHSHEDGRISIGDLKRDTGKTDKVLIGREFAFWGRSGPKLPKHLEVFLKKGPGHRCNFTDAQIAALLAWLAPLRRGYIDEPAHWQFLNKKRVRPGGPRASR
jgi:Nucleotide modification associated domain 2